MAYFLRSGLIPGEFNKIRRWNLNTGPEHSEFLGKFYNVLRDTTYYYLTSISKLIGLQPAQPSLCKHLPSVMWTNRNFSQRMTQEWDTLWSYSPSYFTSQQSSCKLRLIERKQFHAMLRANCIYYIHREYRFHFIELRKLCSKNKIYFFLPYEHAHVFPYAFFCPMNLK